MRSLLASLLVAAVPALVFGCANSDPIPGLAGPEDGSDTESDENQICLLHNCTEDDHCGGCSGGRNTCLVEEKRCVACNADTGTGCPDGEYCSSWGNCVPDGLECPTDSHGTPTISCSTNADCLACDPMHQVCDPASGSCVACTPSDTSACQSTDQCLDNSCAANCPAQCMSDSDCSSCGGPGYEAHACNQHQCAECSPTVPCPNGEVCSPQGVCGAQCGSDGLGSCTSDSQCLGCGLDATECHIPFGSSTGQCGPSAAGCSDLGTNVAVLPEPYDQVTNLCSNDGDCAGVGVTFNVGEMLRNLTGIDDIGDANISYPMNSCAAVSIGDTSCGVCVPCQVDSDCQDIDIDQFALDAFGPIGSLAAAFLLDQVFGPNDHEINMYCQPVAGGYGACVPCPGLIYECGVGEGGGGGGGGGSCSHDVCDQGGALDPSCGSCESAVCANDSYCCNTAWDDVCVGEVAQYCGQSCEGGGNQSSCAHSECVQGQALVASCSSCASAVCAYDDYCCNNDWDDVCVSHVPSICGFSC